jgi:hypothetical protein
MFLLQAFRTFFESNTRLVLNMGADVWDDFINLNHKHGDYAVIQNPDMNVWYISYVIPVYLLHISDSCVNV